MTEPIRILHVIGSMNCGGAENMIMNLYRNVDRVKVQFDFLVHTDKLGFFDEEIESLGGKIYRVNKFKGANIRQYRLQINRFFDEHKEFSIVHGHIGSCSHIYLGIAKKHGMFAIAHSHSTKPTDISVKNIMYKLFSLKTRKVADFFIGCSLKSGEYRFGKKLVNSDRFAVLKNAIATSCFVYDENLRNETRSEFGIEKKAVIGHIGRFSYPKNHDYLLDIFAEFAKINKNAVLVLVGDGELKKEIENKVCDLGLEGRVIFTGIRKDVNRLLQAMDLFVFPSHYEGLPVTVVEAQASGVPCLVSENITDEVCITDLAERLPINVPASVWSEKIMNIMSGSGRKNMSEEIKRAGYDIATTAEWLTKFYVKTSER